MSPASKPLRTIAAALLTALSLLSIGIWAASAQTTTDVQLEQGAALYVEYCAVCHGPEGRGRVGATLAKDWPSVRPDLTVKTIIENGISGSRMPAWSSAKGGPLSTEEIDALTAYILNWQTGGSSNILIVPTPTPLPPVTPLPEIVGDTTNGAVLFQQNCIMCHGEGGRGKIGKTLAKNWSGVRPELFIKNTIANGIPNTTMPAWSQSTGGPLSDQEMNDLVAYILALPKVAEVQVTADPAGATSLSWFSGWGGIFIFLILLAVIIGLALYFQRRK